MAFNPLPLLFKFLSSWLPVYIWLTDPLPRKFADLVDQLELQSDTSLIQKFFTQKKWLNHIIDLPTDYVQY